MRSDVPGYCKTQLRFDQSISSYRQLTVSQMGPALAIQHFRADQELRETRHVLGIRSFDDVVLVDGGVEAGFLLRVLRGEGRGFQAEKRALGWALCKEQRLEKSNIFIH